MKARGFDVSQYNRSSTGERIDWFAVKEAKEVDFCIIRARDGLLLDEDYNYNRTGAELHELPFGLYQAFYPNIDPKRQAELLAASVADVPLFIAGDFEKSKGLDRNKYLSIARIYINEFEQLAGIPMMIYTSPWFGSYYLQGQFPNNPLWIANPYSIEPSLPDGWDTWWFWQYSWIDSFVGIADKTVDADYYNGTVEELKEAFGLAPTLEERVADLERRVSNLEALHA